MVADKAARQLAHEVFAEHAPQVSDVGQRCRIAALDTAHVGFHGVKLVLGIAHAQQSRQMIAV